MLCTLYNLLQSLSTEQATEQQGQEEVPTTQEYSRLTLSQWEQGHQIHQGETSAREMREHEMQEHSRLVQLITQQNAQYRREREQQEPQRYQEQQRYHEGLARLLRSLHQDPLLQDIWEQIQQEEPTGSRIVVAID